MLSSAIALVRTECDRFEGGVGSIREFRVVNRVFLRRYHVMMGLEASDLKEIGSVVLEMRKLSGVVFTENLAETS